MQNTSRRLTRSDLEINLAWVRSHPVEALRVISAFSAGAAYAGMTCEYDESREGYVTIMTRVPPEEKPHAQDIDG